MIKLILFIQFMAFSAFAQVVYKTPIAHFANGNFIGAGLHDGKIAIYGQQGDRISPSLGISAYLAKSNKELLQTHAMLAERDFVILNNVRVGRSKLMTLKDDGQVQELTLQREHLSSVVAVSDQLILVADLGGSVYLIEVPTQRILKTISLEKSAFVFKSKRGRVYLRSSNFPFAQNTGKKYFLVHDPMNLENLESVEFDESKIELN